MMSLVMSGPCRKLGPNTAALPKKAGESTQTLLDASLMGPGFSILVPFGLCDSQILFHYSFSLGAKAQ